jgi:hypothetical protein
MNKFISQAVLGVVITLGSILVMASKTAAQQTIFNAPSSDVLDKGKVYLELDSIFRFNETRSLNKFSSFVPRSVFGIGGNTEVGVNITGNINPGIDQTTISPTIKHRLYNGKDNGMQMVIGDNVFIPVRNKSYNIGNYAYAQISKTFKSNTRITGGAYYFTKNVIAAAARAGGQFGFEQTVNKYFNINADYYTGRHAAGYFTPGVVFKPHPPITGYIGFSIGNDNPRTNNFFYAAVGINLN